MHTLLRALAEDYELTLLVFSRPTHLIDTDLFDGRVERVSIAAGDFSAITDNDYSLVFYPDIGLSLESIIMSNVRLAPVQVTGYGHPVSTRNCEIDYFIAGAATENVDRCASDFDERVVLIPGAGLIPSRPTYTQTSTAEPRQDEIRIACPWAIQKINYPWLTVIARILERCKHPKIGRAHV